MFTKGNTRIIFTKGSVVVLRQLHQDTNRCRILIDGIEKGNLLEISGRFAPEGNIVIDETILLRINDLAKSETTVSLAQ